MLKNISTASSTVSIRSRFSLNSAGRLPDSTGDPTRRGRSVSAALAGRSPQRRNREANCRAAPGETSRQMNSILLETPQWPRTVAGHRFNLYRRVLGRRPIAVCRWRQDRWGTAHSVAPNTEKPKYPSEPAWLMSVTVVPKPDIVPR